MIQDVDLERKKLFHRAIIRLVFFLLTLLFYAFVNVIASNWCKTGEDLEVFSLWSIPQLCHNILGLELIPVSFSLLGLTFCLISVFYLRSATRRIIQNDVPTKIQFYMYLSVDLVLIFGCMRNVFETIKIIF
jgi:hypothetical protein